MSKVLCNDVISIKCKLENELSLHGFEFHPFKIAWYNSLVQPVFKINCNEDTVAFLVISAPKMFERAFIPFLSTNKEHLTGLKDPIDECMVYYLSKIPQIFPDHRIKLIHDFELHSNRRPKIIMQSIAHACGAAYFYHPKCVLNHEWTDKKMFGVCIHPKYGGWFALRAVVLFENLCCPDLPRTLPSDVVSSSDERVKLLELYNFHWKDWRFRDIIPVSEKYSDLQRKYFSALPGKRDHVIKCILNEINVTNGH